MSSLLNVLNTWFLSSLCLFSFLSSSFCSSFLCSSIRFFVAAFNCFFLWLYDTFSIFISAATCVINTKIIMAVLLTYWHTLLLIHLGFTNYWTTVTATTSIMYITEIIWLIWASCRRETILGQYRWKLNLSRSDYNYTHPLFMRLSNNSDSFGLQDLFLIYCLVFGLVLIWQLFLQSPWNNQWSEHLWLTFDWLQNRLKYK